MSGSMCCTDREVHRVSVICIYADNLNGPMLQVRGQEVTQEGAGNARLKALGVREDVTQDVLNPGAAAHNTLPCPDR